MTCISSRWTSLAAITVAVAAAVVPQAAQAVVKHRYTFDGNANDSVGTAHGAIIDPGAQTHQFFNGMLVMTGNTGENSDVNDRLGPVEDAYVDLPDLIIQNAANAGTSGALSLEAWFTVGTHRTWQRLGDFAGPHPADPSGLGSEGLNNYGNVDYIALLASADPNHQGIQIEHQTGDDGTDVSGGLGGGQIRLNASSGPPAYPVGVQKHVVAVVNKNDTTRGPGGSLRLFIDGVELVPGQAGVDGTGALREDFNLNSLADEDNWLGRSQWGDPIFDGVYNEFAIYDHPLSAAEVTANFAAGPIGGTVLPAATINRDTGAITLSSPNGTLPLVGYTLRSARGTLIPENWFEIAMERDAMINGGDGSFDADDFWVVSTENPPTPTILQEAMLVAGFGADDGGPLGATPLSVTDAGQRLWRKYYVEDVSVVMQVKLPSGAFIELPAAVTFTGGAGVPWRRSDLNFDGSISAADYVIFRDNHRDPITTPANDDPASYPFGDLDGDQDNDFADFRIFKMDFDAANGVGAFAALGVPIPEPSSATLVALVVALGLVRRRRGT